MLLFSVPCADVGGRVDHGVFHLFIISTIPLAVPLEWNVFFIFAAAFLFAELPAGDGYGVGDMNPVVLPVFVAALMFFPVLGTLRPDVSFLLDEAVRRQLGVDHVVVPRQGEGGPAQRADREGRRQPDRPARAVVRQEISEIFMQKAIAFRMMHPMGRVHISVLHAPHRRDSTTA